MTDDEPTEDVLVTSVLSLARKAIPLKAVRALRGCAVLLHQRCALTAERWARLSDEITNTTRRAMEPWRN